MLRFRCIFQSKFVLTQISTGISMTGRVMSHRKFWELIDKSSEKMPLEAKVDKVPYETPCDYIGHAEDEMAKGDVIQCCEKLSAGVKKALRIYVYQLLTEQGHGGIEDIDEEWNQGRYKKICRLIRREVKDEIFIDGWNAANDLHIDGWNRDVLDMDDVKLEIPKIKKFIRTIEDLPNVKMQDPAGLARKILKEFHKDGFDPEMKAESLKTRQEVVESFNKISVGKVKISLENANTMGLMGMGILKWQWTQNRLRLPWIQQRFGPSKMSLVGTKNCMEEGGAMVIGNVLSVVEQISSPQPVKRAQGKSLGPKEKNPHGPRQKTIGTEQEKSK